MMVLPYADVNPTRTAPFVTIGLIVANVLVFLYEISAGGNGLQRLTAMYGAIPLEIVTGRDIRPFIDFPVHVTLLTSIFMHASWSHLLGNMLYLWIFGDNVEDAMGHGRFAIFYLICGLIASLAHIVSDLTSTIPSVGASGAISGVLGAYLVLYPRGQVKVFVWLLILIRVIQAPAWLMLGFWFLLQFWQALGSGAESGVAVWAHVGGFIAGVVLARIFAKPRGALSYRSW